ncbi:MAG: alpha-N-acetylglucosaminidase C-terminal domain-containing protein, partial [Anaerorhabdus sp.]
MQTFLLDKDIAAGKEDYYQKVSETFYKVQKDIYGDISPYYAVDPFHEGGNKGDLWGQDTKLYKTIQDSMIKANKDAVWIMQKWGSNANPTQLQDLDKNHVVVLDLYSEMEPHNDEINNTGTPWIWNMLHNFGGRAGMDGQPEVLATVIPKDKQTKNKMVGIGITPEAINNSPMMYELLFDMTWTKDPIDYRAWTSKYIERRYGKTTPEIEKAWDILLDTVYSTKTTRPGQGAPETVVNWKPSMETFSNASTWGHSITAYDIKEFEKAINLFIAAYPDFKDSDAFKYDFIDVTTQAISNSAKTYHKAMSAAYEKANLNEFDRISKQFIDLIKLEDKVLSTNKEFMVGSWINKSRKMLDNADDWTNDLFELNARSLISVWGSSSTDDLLDYSNRQLSGITQDYYLQRWETAIGEFRERIKAGNVSNKKLDSNKYWLMGWKWANQKSDEGHGYSEKVNNYDLSQLAQEVYDKHSLASLDKFLSGENVADAKVNVALNKTVTSNKGTDTAFPLTNLTDEKSGTLWKQNSDEWPTELTLDLAGRFSINGISFTMQPIAGGVDLAYKVEVFDEGSWKTVVNQAQSTIIGTINVPYIGEGSKVRYTFNHTGGSLVPTFDEVMVYGVPYEAAKTNVARGKTVTLNPNNGPYQLENITDGDVNTIGAGGETEFGKVTPEMILDLNGTFDASNVTVYMEQTANLGFKFRTSVQLEDDSWEVIDDQSANTELGINKFKFDKAVNKKIKKVKVTYISKSNNNANFWPGCAEIEVWSPVELPEEEIEIERPNVALNAVATAERGQENAAFVTDGNLSTFWHYNANEYPGTIKVDLGNQKLIDTARVNFEVPADSPKGRAFKFIINAYDENNNKVFVDDQSNRSGKIPYYDAKINKEVRYIEVSLTGKDLVAEPGAWPAIMEIQAFLPLNNIAKTATVSATPNLDVSLIHDDNNNTGIDVAGTKNIFEFSLDKAQDINAFEIIKGSAEPLKYMIETKENDSDSYATFIDKSKNTNKNNKNVITIGTPKLVKKLRLTILNENYTLNEVRLYEYNAFNKVITQISNIEKNIDKVVIGDKVGNYTQASLDKVKNILTTVRSEIVKAGKLNSKEADAYLETVKNAYLEFKKTGFVSVDRIELFTAIVHAEDVKKFIIAENISDVLDESFDTTLAASQAVYDKNDVSQTEIDNATKALNALILSIEAKLPKMEQYKLALTRAEDKLKNSVVGSIEGQYTKESKDA